MQKRTMATAGAATLIALGAFAGISIAGNNDQGKIPDARVKVLKPVTAVPATNSSPGAATGKATARKKPTVRYFVAQQATVPPEGGGVVQAIKCPKSAGSPIAGGARTSIGIVVSYLSRVKPGQAGRTPARTYYVGVDDNSTTNAAGSGAVVEVQCATGITVKPG